MTTRQADELATAMLSRIPLVEARADDPRVVSGELVLASAMQKDLAGWLLGLWDDLEQMCDEVAVQAEGKSASEISQMWAKRLAKLKSQHQISCKLRSNTR